MNARRCWLLVEANFRSRPESSASGPFQRGLPNCLILLAKVVVAGAGFEPTTFRL